MAPQAKESTMRRIVVTEFISLDGVVEDPGGSEGTRHGGWTFRFNDPEGMKYKLEETLGHDAMLLGRVTYEGFAAAWPERTDEAGFADRINSMKKYVVSSTLTDPAWQNSEVLGPDLKAEVERIKAEPGGDILVAGSVSLVQGLLALDLVDELRLMTFPIVLGAGKRLFAASEDAITLKLASAQPLESGTVILTYVRPE
jgi:dihydrofolate reductase